MLQKFESLLRSNTNVFLLIGRLFIGLTMAFAHGYPKLMNMSGFTANVAKMGLPLPELSAALAMTAELLGGLMIAIGFRTRFASFALLFTMLVAGFIVHGADPFAKKEMALLYAASCLLLLGTGPGKFSVDKN